MKRATLALYVLFGIGAVAAGIGAIVLPRIALPPGATGGLASHLVQEQGAGFVFIGLMMLWCARHYEQRRPVHLALVVFTALFAGVHLQGYLRDGSGFRYVIVNLVPFALMALTAPWSRSKV